MATPTRFCKVLWTVIIALGGWQEAVAEVRLPAVIGDSMVLQRDARIRVWGWADPGEPVALAFLGDSFRTRADTPAAGRYPSALILPAGPMKCR